MPKITRLEIKSFRGIRDLSIDVPPEGAIVSGGNARGKSSVLKAISAALAGQGIGADAIRNGDSQAEILIDLDALRVRRAITEKGSSLTVTNADGDRWSKPQTRLNDLFGTAALDALSFFLADPRERRRILLEALPVTVTLEDVERWIPGASSRLEGWRISLDGHGLEVLERLHQLFYGLRTDVNKAAKEARAAADAAANFEPAPEGAVSLEEASKASAAAAQRIAQLQARELGAAEAAKGAAKTRALIDEAEARAQRYRDAAGGAPTEEQIAAEKQEYAARASELQRLEEAVKKARTAEGIANTALVNLTEARERADRAIQDALAEEARANDLRGTISDVDAMAVPAEELAAARAEVDRTSALVTDATKVENARKATEYHAQMDALAVKREGDAAEIDAIVKRLATDAPQELAKRSTMIPGLGINGDAITLDGVSLTDLSGAEQMRFAVDLCKRLNAKAKILVVDGLERLDDDALDSFVETATADGWQLIGTRVSRGELVIEALSPGKAAA